MYDDTDKCLELLSSKYKIGIIANQSLGTKERLEQHGVLQYFDLVVASAEEGVAKPDKRIFEIALERADCVVQSLTEISNILNELYIPEN